MRQLRKSNVLRRSSSVRGSTRWSMWSNACSYGCVVELLKRVWHNILTTDVLGLAAQTAYFFFFSLFPLLLFTAPLLSLVGNKAATVGIIMQALARSVPPDAYLLIQNVVNDVVFSKSAPGVVSVGAILTI